jgi:hypothetical protein
MDLRQSNIMGWTSRTNGEQDIYKVLTVKPHERRHFGGGKVERRMMFKLMSCS